MLKIIVPTMAANSKDVELMLYLLERTVPKNYEIGLEIIGKADHFKKPEDMAKIVENITKLAKGAYLSVHGFSGLAVYESGLADMTKEESGGKLLDAYSDIADKTRANYVHVHSGAGYKGINNAPKDRKGELNKIRNILLSRASRSKIPIGIENLPSPSMGDMETDPVQIWCDTVASIDDCLDIVKDSNLKITFDTCHYASDKEGEIDLVTSLQKLGAYTDYLHISDIQGRWIPYQSVWQEGVMPGQGRIGEEQFKRFFQYIKENYSDAGLCIEVTNQDFKNPLETEESIKKVLGWLK